MSMDLEVWSTRDFNLPAELPQSTLWKRYDEEFAFEGDEWQVLVLSEQREPDPSVVHKLPGANFLASITLAPIWAGAGWLRIPGGDGPFGSTRGRRGLG